MGFASLSDFYKTNPHFGKVWAEVNKKKKKRFYATRWGFNGAQLCIVFCSLRLKTIDDLHKEGHIQRDRTLQLVTASYYWHGVLRDVERYVECCRACQLAKRHASNAGLYLPLPVIAQLWIDLNMDFVLGLP